ncbi:hypothetical protein GS625_08090 [Ruegeria sp. HKCCD7319]|nr:hypothetical protein [Ruegeria sp. HKCCD7319]
MSKLRSGQFRSCTPLDKIEFTALGTEVLHVYSDLTWAPDGARQHPDIYLRWLHVSPDGTETLVASYPDVPAYRWRPSQTVPVTRWHIEVTVWKDLEGSFVFQAYTQPAAIEDSLIEQLSVPVIK